MLIFDQIEMNQDMLINVIFRHVSKLYFLKSAETKTSD